MEDANSAKNKITKDQKFLHDLLNRVGAAKMNAELALRNKGLPDTVRTNLERVVANLNQVREMLCGLPSGGGTAQAVPEAEESKDQPSRSRSESRAKSVLLIDDSDDLRVLFTAVLRPRGFDFSAARDQDEALAYLGSHPEPDLILLDYMLKDMTGPEVLDAFERLGISALKKSKIVLFTAMGDQVSEPRACAVEPKSMDIASIVQLVKKYCG